MSTLATNNIYYSNAIVGDIQVGADIDIYEVNTTPKWAVGSGFVRSDGARFRYGQFGVTTTAGVLCSSVIADVLSALTTDAVIAPASAIAVSGDNIKPGAAGSRYFEMTLANVSRNEYAGGYCVLNDGTSRGFTYRIRGNTATGDPASGNIRIQLYEPLQISLDATTDVILMASPYTDLRTSVLGAGSDNIVAGVTMNRVPAASFGWIQTRGYVGCKAGGTLTESNIICGGAAGACTSLPAMTTANITTAWLDFVPVGRSVRNGTTGLQSLVWIAVE